LASHESREVLAPSRAGRTTGRFKPALEAQGDEQVVVKTVIGAFFGTDLGVDRVERILGLA